MGFELKGVACHLGNTLGNWPHTCSIPKAGVTAEVCTTTHERPDPGSWVLNMVRTQPVPNDCL